MKVSILESTSNKILDQSDVTWQELKQLLSVHEHHPLRSGEDPADAKRRITMFSPCEFQPNKPRSNTNALRIHFGVIDCDDITKEQLDALKSKLALYNYVCYTSWSHTKELEHSGKYRLRFVFPFTKPVAASMWTKVWNKLNFFFNGALDPACKDLQRGYYLPAASKLEDHWITSNVGLDFDPTKLLQTSDSELKLGKVTQADLLALSKKLNKKKSDYSKRFAETIQEAVDGRPFAEHGNRDDTLFKLASTIAREFETFDSAQVADLFHKSLEAMRDVGSRKATKHNFIEKLDRAQENVKAEKQQVQAETEEATSERIRLAFGTDADRDYPYSLAELQDFADSSGCGLKEFGSRWIIQYSSSFYVFFNGNYLPPVPEKSLVSLCDKFLAPAISAGVTLSKSNANGTMIRMSPQELVLNYGMTCTKGRASMIDQFSYYDSNTRTFVEATCPKRVTEAVYDSEVALFLEMLGGSDHTRLLDFVSAITDTDKPCAALYLHSPPGYGKNLLIKGLSRIWTTEATTTLANATSQFNDSLAECPLVFADETMPESYRRSGNSGDWREFIQSTQRKINRKFLSLMPLDGAVRLIMAANNKDMLGLKEDLTSNDLDAIVERLCFIDCDNPKVKEWLADRGTELNNPMVADDRIAKHALWLRENHVILGKHRFIVSSVNTSFHRMLSSGSGLSTAIVHWLVSYLQQPNLVDMSNVAGLIRIKDGELLVTTKGLSDGWDSYNTHYQSPTPARITKALGPICKKEMVTKKIGKKAQRYWVLDTETLIAWAEIHAYASREDILDALTRETRIKEDETFNSLLGKQGITA